LSAAARRVLDPSPCSWMPGRRVRRPTRGGWPPGPTMLPRGASGARPAQETANLSRDRSRIAGIGPCGLHGLYRLAYALAAELAEASTLTRRAGSGRMPRPGAR
jgi:hypothetical protein